MKVGFIGLGAMGAPMAERVAAAGHELVITIHRRRYAAESLAARGAQIVGSPAEVACLTDTIITVLPADAELKETVLGTDGLLRTAFTGKVLIEMTSATALTLREVEQAILSAGGRVIDAPVSGGTTGAANGTLTVMVGAEPDLLESYRPILEIMGKIIHVGAAGQGKVVKMINQMMAAIHLLAIGEAFALGIRSGAAPGTLYRIIKESSGYSKMMDLRLPGFLLAGSFEPGFKLDLMKKDISLALESARAEKVPLFLTAAAGQIFSAASAAGKGEADFSAAAQFLAALAGVSVSEADAQTREHAATRLP